MRKMYFLNFVMLTVGLSVLVSTVNPLIKLWLGEKMLLSQGAVWVICASFYLSCIRDPVQIFINAYGLYKETRLIPVVRAGVNLVLSVFFVRKLGITGVFLGTVLSTALVPLLWEVKMLYKYGFGNISPRPFIREMTQYIAISFCVSAVSFCVTRFVEVSFLGLVIRAAISCGVSVIAVLLAFGNGEYLGFCLEYARKLLTGRKDKIKA